MEKLPASYEDELRASPAFVRLALVGMGILLGMIVSTRPELLGEYRLFVVCIFAAVITSWLMDRLNETSGTITLLVGVSALIFLAQGWFRVPGTLALLVIPVWLAMALVGWKFALTAALLNTLFLAWLSAEGWLQSGGSENGMAVFAIWAGMASVSAVYYPIHRVAGWSQAYYHESRDRLIEAQERQGQLAQALDDLMHANRQLGLLNERISILRKAAEEARRSKDNFVARVSHEFRAPLNIIIGMVSLMVDHPQVYSRSLPPKATEHLQIVYRSCLHLASMIDDVLDLTQAEGGKVVLHRELVDLGDLTRSALEIVRPLLENKTLALQVDIPANLALVYCDRLRIRQVILNLLSNAARYTDAGCVTVRLRQEENSIQIEVTDTGPGIAVEDGENVFEPFSPVGNEGRRESGGSGLGLSISKQFVDLHDGRIWFESQPGIGSSFYVRLPFSNTTSPQAAPSRWITADWIWRERRPASERVSYSGGVPLVIICDESGEIAPFLSQAEPEFELLEFRSIDQAVEEARTSPPQAFVLNIPHPNGVWSQLERLRQELKDTPIVLVSFPPHVDQSIRAGASGYVLKPLTGMALETAIDALDQNFSRILVVDDDADTRLMMGELLRMYDENMEISFAENGVQALELMRIHGPELILLDVVMPEMSGWDVLAAKQQDPAMNDIAVIMVSAQDLHEGPSASRFLLATIGDGLPARRLIQCLESLSKIMLQGE
jgi:signal transduction histidine kinase/CheY-like chemotaxis protein